MYFYLEWTDKRPTKIEIVEEKPLNINYESPPVIINQVQYLICGNINPEFNTYYGSPRKYYSKNQYLLSHLQKCVRRMEPVKSVKTAKHLIDLDLISFLRRLPIIMLEDVSIHSSLPVIIWLMIAVSKKFIIKHEMVKWLLGVVYYLSNEYTKTDYLNKDIEEFQWDPQLYSESTNNILKTLQFRKCYGGMKGDMNMIEYYIGLIVSQKIKVLDEKIPLIKTVMEPLSKKEWIYQANDFHCNKYILNMVYQYYPYLGHDYIKKLIWNFSSSTNNRKLVEHDQKDYEEWIKIKNRVKAIQKNCRYY